MSQFALLPFVGQNKVHGYYIQGVEPYFYLGNSPEYSAALNAYASIDNIDTAARFFPEHTALNILQVLFNRKRPAASIEFEYLRVADSE